MKIAAYLLLLGLCVTTPMVYAQEDAAPETTTEETAAAEPTIDEKAVKKQARRYWQTKMATKKKAVSILKKVKDVKSAKKAAKSLEKLCKKEVKAPESNEFTDAVERSFLMHIEKLDEQLDEQVERIDGLGGGYSASGEQNEKPMTDELKAAIDKVKA
jgi:hypothetical protein